VQILAAACVLVYIATATVAGSRLLWVARRTRRLPELLLGVGSLLIGLALPVSIASGFGGPTGQVDVPLWVASELVTQIGVVCLYAFTQQVFRAGVAWARVPVALAAFLLPFFLTKTAVALAAAPAGTPSSVASGVWLLLCHVGYAGAFVWSALEGLHHHAMARKRLALGLADPVVANRFLLFAIFGLACTGIAAANALCAALGRNLATSLVVVLPAAALAPVAAAAIFLAILPPDWYLERVRTRA
jgi:hypothetical protein